MGGATVPTLASSNFLEAMLSSTEGTAMGGGRAGNGGERDGAAKAADLEAPVSGVDL